MHFESAGLGAPARRRRSEIHQFARGACEAAATPQIRSAVVLQKNRTRRSAASTSIPPGKAKRLHMSPGPIFEPEGHGTDFGGAARAPFAAGFRPGTSCTIFSDHLTPGLILEAGAHALGCAVIPGGIGNTEQQLDAIAHYKPSGYIGTPDFIKILLDTAAKTGRDASSIKRGLFRRGAAGDAARGSLRGRGVAVVQCYAIAEVG